MVDYDFLVFFDKFGIVCFEIVGFRFESGCL